MTAPTAIAILLITWVAVGVTWLASRVIGTWRRFRGARIVTCPENGRAAGVHIDVGHAVATALLDDDPAVRLDDCSRWPTRGLCAQLCVNDARRSIATVRSIAARWYAGRPCVYCGKTIVVQMLDHRAALLKPGGATAEWSDIPAAELPLTLLTSRAVCWNCHVAESFRREHPELVTDRN